MRPMNLIGILFLIFALILALTLHEFAHALASDYLGDTTARQQGRLSINPIVHIDPLMTLIIPLTLLLAGSPVLFGGAKPVPFNPWAVRYGKWGVAIVAAAGPLMNFLLAIFFAIWLHFLPISPTFYELFVRIIVTNIALGIFNLLPIPPLDGSRILYAAAPLGLRDLMDTIERAGLIVVFILLFLLGPHYVFPVINAIVGSIVQILIPGLTGL